MAKEEFVVFDFDGTLYKGDCSIDFYLFLVKKKPLLLAYLPLQAFYFLLWKLEIVNTDRFKSIYFSFLNNIRLQDLNALVNLFWNSRTENSFNSALHTLVKERIAEGYACVVITASPEIIVQPLVERLFGIDTIGTLLENRNGNYALASANCKGLQKVTRFEKRYGANAVIKEAYSDNASDAPLFKRSLKAYKIQDSAIIPL